MMHSPFFIGTSDRARSAARLDSKRDGYGHNVLNGIYFVKGLAAADTSDRNLTLILSADGTAALATEFVGRGTMIERGRWNAEQSRADITWTELDGKEIHLRMSFELRGNALVYIGPDPNAFGSAGISLSRMEPVA